MEKVYWLSAVPANCQVCDGPLGDTFIDGPIGSLRGPWGLMCNTCFTLGPGLGKLGTGIGQKYVKQADGKWLKVEG